MKKHWFFALLILAVVIGACENTGDSVDTGNTEQPTITGVTVTPVAAVVSPGSSRRFAAEVSGTNNPARTVTWSVSGSASSINQDGLLTVSAKETDGTLIVTATSTVDTSVSGTSTVTVTPIDQPGIEPYIPDTIANPPGSDTDAVSRNP